jgi:hypothetical protein
MIVHGRLYRFECEACGDEYIAVGATDDNEAIAMARANGWVIDGPRGYCPDCNEPYDPGDGFVWLPGGGSTVM